MIVLAVQSILAAVDQLGHQLKLPDMHLVLEAIRDSRAANTPQQKAVLLSKHAAFQRLMARMDANMQAGGVQQLAPTAAVRTVQLLAHLSEGTKEFGELGRHMFPTLLSTG